MNTLDDIWDSWREEVTRKAEYKEFCLKALPLFEKLITKVWNDEPFTVWAFEFFGNPELEHTGFMIHWLWGEDPYKKSKTVSIHYDNVTEQYEDKVFSAWIYRDEDGNMEEMDAEGFENVQDFLDDKPAYRLTEGVLTSP